MKHLVTLFTLSIFNLSFSQEIDSVVLGAGYPNESYYSLANGEISNVSNVNWDLAFDLSAFGATIRFNRKTDILYLYPGSASDWNTLDTTGHDAWDQYIDSYEDWASGALNAPASSADPADLGWGSYNTITHVTEGTRIFVVRLSDNSYRKLFIEQLASGIYTFRFSNIDGTGEVVETITKTDYSGKNFIHYSLLNEEIVVREPASAGWDIVFTNYVLELAPGYFSGVTGVLSNSTFRNLSTAEVDDLPVASTSLSDATFDSRADVIGYNWKTFNMGTFSYEIEDSLCYFIKDENDNTWKLFFTGFSSATGKIYFTKEQITFATVSEHVSVDQEIVIYPLPASELITIQPRHVNLETIQLYNLSGELVTVLNILPETGMITIPVNEFPNGYYLLRMISSDHHIFNEKISIQH